MRTNLTRIIVPIAAFCTAVTGDAESARAGFAVLPNIKATGIEVTQGIQDLDNNVPLVTGKNTYVRVYAQAEQVLSVINDVGAVLVGVRVDPPNPAVLLGFVTPLNPNGKIRVRTTPGRINVDDAFLFQLPPAWRTGTVRLSAVIDPADDIGESNETDNTYLAIVDFEPVPPVRVTLYNVDYPSGDLPSLDDYQNFVSWMRNTYPSKDLLVTQRTYPSQTEWGQDLCDCGPRDMNNKCKMDGTCANDPDRTCTTNSTCGCARLNDILSYMRAMDEVFALPGVFQPDTRYVAWVDDSGGFMRGCSPGVVRKVASGPTGVSGFPWDKDGSFADFYTGHELGHAYGRPHAACCDAVGTDPYPYPNCELSDGSASFYGFDFRNRSVVFPPTWHDIMSYCEFQWLSDFTYEAIRDQLLDEDGAPPPPSGGINDILLVQGEGDLDLGIAALRDIYILRDARVLLPADTAGEFTIRLLDASSAVLASVAFDVAPFFDDPDFVPDGVPRRNPAAPGVGPILQMLPFVPGTSRVVLERLGVELDSRLVTPNTPLVTLVSPNGGENLRGEALVEWIANDPDGDPLTSTLLYSSDGGTSWTAVATQIVGTSVIVNLDGLPGSDDALFRILVSDGFNTGEDESDGPSSVADSPPDVVITSPGNGNVYQADNIVMVEAQANDVEDGPLGGDSIAWRSNRRGFVGTGEALEIHGLAGGRHELEVTATDSAGNRATDQVVVFIDRPVVAPALSPAGLALACAVMSLVALGRLRERRSSAAAPEKAAAAVATRSSYSSRSFSR